MTSVATRRTYPQLDGVLPPILVFVAGILLWEGVVRGFGVPAYLLPAPSEIIVTFGEQLPYLLRISLVTFGEAFGGFLIGCTLGVLVAAICVRWRGLADALVPFSIGANAVPIIALSPLFGIWLGSISPWSKVAVVALMTFFPTLLNTYRGLVSPSAEAITLLRSYAAPQRDIFLKLRLPAALPFLFTALKICTTLSMIGAVVAEFFGGQVDALGVFIKRQAGVLKLREAWSGILMACLIGILFYLIIVLIERWVTPWRAGRDAD